MVYDEVLDEALKLGGVDRWVKEQARFQSGEELSQDAKEVLGEVTEEKLSRIVVYAREAEKEDLTLGDKVRFLGDDSLYEVTDFPGDNSMITLEPSFTSDEDEIIHGIDESEGWGYGWSDKRPVRVGWHIDGREIVEIVRK